MMPLRRSRTAQRVLFPSDRNVPDALYLVSPTQGVSHERSALRLAARAAVSLATYFGAFPAALWMRIARAERVALSGVVQGVVTIRVSVRSAAGVRVRTLAADGAFMHHIPLSSGDQWVWAEIEAGASGAVVSDLSWDLDEVDMGSAAVCVTTHNRPTDCIKVLESIAGDEVLSYLDYVIVVDQGSSRLRDAPGFVEVAELLHGRLRLIEQANLGGSGGFSRGMLEAAALGVDSAVLLDDDVRLEPESVRRLLALSARSDRAVIVGAHMLDLLHPTRLHSWGERVERSRYEWAPVAPDLQDVDLTARDVTTMPADPHVEFNGWWMSLIPTRAVDTLGAALPYFIKWDDTEYSLRAAVAGIPTVTMPGAALWHLPWTGKDDGLDWQAYFQLRNRLVTALLHAPPGRRGSILRSTFALDVNHVLCMQYGSAAARRLALTDILSGPDHLEASLVTRLSDVRDLMARAGQLVVADEDLPAPRASSTLPPPRGASTALLRLGRVIAHQCRTPANSDETVVDRRLTRSDGKWWMLGLLDSATVESATGRGSFVARRDRATALALLRDAVVLRVRLWKAWSGLARAYRAAAPELASAEAWKARYERTNLSSCQSDSREASR